MKANVSIEPIADLSEDFIKGADISMLPEIEESGGRYFNEGNEVDPLVLLKEKGVNSVRIRVWVDPYDEHGNAYGGGTVDENRAIELAKRADSLGFSLLIDFHYSDFWTDPGKQFKPKSWESYNHEQLKQAIYIHTTSVLTRLKAAGVTPEMVQVGNEINSGVLWPDGKSWGEGGGEFDSLADFLNAGLQAVRDSDPSIQTMLHLAEGGDLEMVRWWMEEIALRGVDFDVMGLSYYPYWDGDFNKLKAVMDYITHEHNKESIIVETAYGFTTHNGDTLDNIFSSESAELVGYPATPQGQATYLRDLMEVVHKANGVGFYYWEPLWIPVNGAPWATEQGMQYIKTDGDVGNAWDNQAVFDFNGEALPSLNVFHLVNPEQTN
ncbi:glycoside hydrolase family 53 protein [Shouchella patagoniensis]|uniref:glycoside hydrolase family 53 protein n=1 Tax=Shouchella patagoniensis TaxID=228576 RepID=UPI00099513F1|nr:glycosyl hydrolase 53 family protein [Shouchella patagoniensis]